MGSLLCYGAGRVLCAADGVEFKLELAGNTKLCAAAESGALHRRRRRAADGCATTHSCALGAHQSAHASDDGHWL